MASVYRSLSAALAAALLALLLGACSGGDETPQVQVQSAPAEVVQALSGPVVQASGDRARILAVATPASKSGFSLTADIKLAGTVSAEERAQKQATASAVLPLATKAANVLNWAEAQAGLKQYFPNPQVSQDICIAEGCFTYRLYPETGNIVGIKMDGPDAGGIYLYGTYVGNVLTRYAHVDDSTFRCIADVDSCRPTVTSTTPQNGAVDVSAKGTVVNFTFSEPINCAGIDGTGEVGSDVKVIVTISCRSASRTVTITPMDNRWPFGIEARLTISGVQNLAGYPSLPVEVAFKTKPVQVTPSFYIGDQKRDDGSNIVHVISPEGMITKEVVLPPVPGLNLAHRMLADHLTGQLWVMPWVTMRLYAVDLEDHQVATLDLSPALDTYFLLEGAFIKGADFCTALARSFTANVWTGQNKLACWNRTTKSQTLTAKNFLAEEGMRTLRIDLVGNKLYLVNGLDTAHDNSNFLWLPGTPGELRVLNPTTFALERKVKVGSVPVDFAVHPTSGDVWVINGGDKSLSVVHPNGNVETMPMSGLSESAYQRPTNIVMNTGKGQVYITDGYQNLIVYDMATRREVRRIPLGTVGSSPRTMLLRGLDLYVVLTNRGTVMKVNVDTFEVTTFATSLGVFPGVLYGVGL
jgi:DNA-binding beta-propeller fold protein YncE